jgi:hypothetical protein
VLFRSNQTNNVANDIEFWSFDESDRASNFTKGTNNVYENSNTVISPTALVDENTGNIHVAYLRGALEATMGVYYKTSTDGGNTWSAESQNLSPGIIDDYKYLRGNLLSTDRLFLFWYNDDLDDIMGNVVPFLIGGAISISISTDGIINFGGLYLDDTQDNTISGVNDIEVLYVDSGPVDLDIQSTIFSDGSNDWSFGAVNGVEQVKWEFATSTDNWSYFANPNINYPMDYNVSSMDNRNIYFRVTLPSATAVYSQYSATVTITASAP